MATVDLPPGARGRMWTLLVTTTIAGSATYAVFGRTEILWIAGLILAVLVYLLMGVSLARKVDLKRLKPGIDTILAEPRLRQGLVLDANGLVLHMSRRAEALTQHSQILVGQRLGDVLQVSVEARKLFNEMLRFANTDKGWNGVLSLIAEDGAKIAVQLRSIQPPPMARKLSLIILADPTD